MDVVSTFPTINFAMLWTALGSIALLLGKAALVFIICRILAKFLLRTCDKLFCKLNMEEGIRGFARNVANILLWGLTGVIVAETLGIDTTALVAMLSVASLALSLSVQNVLTDVFSGVTILMSQPFKVGQFVEIAGVSGTVKAVSIMRTTLETPDHKEILIPNSEITAAKITNFSSEPVRRVDLSFCASYDAPTALVKQALLEAIQADPRIHTEPAPFVGLQSYEVNDIRYVAKVWCSSADYWGVYYDLNERVREVFAKYHIAFSYPHVVVHTEE